MYDIMYDSIIATMPHENEMKMQQTENKETSKQMQQTNKWLCAVLVYCVLYTYSTHMVHPMFN